MNIIKWLKNLVGLSDHYDINKIQYESFVTTATNLNKRSLDIQKEIEGLKKNISESVISNSVNINTTLKKLEEFSERLSRTETMHNEIFKRANDTFKDSMQALIAQSTEFHTKIVEFADQKVKDIFKEAFGTISFKNVMESNNFVPKKTEEKPAENLSGSLLDMDMENEQDE